MLLSAPNCLMNIRWRLDAVYRDWQCVLSSPTGDVPLSVSWLWQCHILSSPDNELTPAQPGSGHLRRLWPRVGECCELWSGKNSENKEEKCSSCEPTNLIYRKMQKINLLYGEEPQHSDCHEWWGGESPSKLSVFRTSQLWSRQDEPGGDWTLGAVEDIFCEWLQWLSPVTSPGCRGSHPQSPVPVCCRSWNWTWGRQTRQS